MTQNPSKFLIFAKEKRTGLSPPSLDEVKMQAISDAWFVKTVLQANSIQ